MNSVARKRRLPHRRWLGEDHELHARSAIAWTASPPTAGGGEKFMNSVARKRRLPHRRWLGEDHELGGAQARLPGRRVPPPQVVADN